MPFVLHEFSEVIACFSAFKEDVACDSQEPLLAEFRLQEQSLVPVKVVLLDSTEPLESVRSSEFVEGNVSVDSLPEQTDGHGCVPDKFRISTDVQLLLGVTVVA